MLSYLGPSFLLTALYAVGVDAACSNFDLVQSVFTERGETQVVPYLLQAGPPLYRVSNGFLCDSNTRSSQCPGTSCAPQVVNGTFLAAMARSNITTTSMADAAHIMSLAQQKLNISFPMMANTTLGSPDAETFSTCIPDTEAGYVTFTPDYNCAQGILSCDGGPVSNGTAVMLCAPAIRGSSSQLVGALDLVTADPSAVTTLSSLSSSATTVSTTTTDGLRNLLATSGSGTQSPSSHNVAPTPVGPATATVSSASSASSTSPTTTGMGSSQSPSLSSTSPSASSNQSSATLMSAVSSLGSAASSTGSAVASKSPSSASPGLQHITLNEKSVFFASMIAAASIAAFAFML